ncbi:hypothetical protein CLV59_104184 [Chitinophaga dinghuensis]|uniref:Uncharacterized protein n=1 Tax=Chitinophaga dinghuensis TaxID=1539050 RepID=A0A327VYB8_9BACT|nr:hypothetical protein [Chitinophaga dinghuensis]RAJ81959.1 hypothetical protein CLV59_104184 [Chitinophaga dinghuensis]
MELRNSGWNFPTAYCTGPLGRDNLLFLLFGHDNRDTTWNCATQDGIVQRPIVTARQAGITYYSSYLDTTTGIQHGIARLRMELPNGLL